jgi:alcohol dehydrogenase
LQQNLDSRMRLERGGSMTVVPIKERAAVLEPERSTAALMKALVYGGPGKRAWEDRPRPVLLDASDALVRITTTTICGTDLHILKGDVPTVTEGRILGHEGVGVIEEVGAAVSSFRKGDRVVVSCITSCGDCPPCRKAMYSHCRTGGWRLGHTIDGTQAEFVRIPHADASLHRAPEGIEEEALVMLSDVLPTGFEVGVLNGRVGPGDTVAIVGAGAIGLAALLTAQLYSPSEVIVVDVDEHRLLTASAFGATRVVNSSDGLAAAAVLDLTGGVGVDVAIEAVGLAATFDLCQSIVAPGGRIANVGVHGKPVLLHLETLWSQNVTLTTGLVDTSSTPLLLRMAQSGKLQPGRLVTHRFPLGETMAAYDAFANAGQEKALKVVLQNA